jgi:hypothetical protein
MLNADLKHSSYLPQEKRFLKRPDWTKISKTFFFSKYIVSCLGQDLKIKLNPRQTIKSNNIVTQFSRFISQAASFLKLAARTSDEIVIQLIMHHPLCMG